MQHVFYIFHMIKQTTWIPTCENVIFKEKEKDSIELRIKLKKKK